MPSAAAAAELGAQLLGEPLEPEDGRCAVLLGDRDHEGVDGEAGRVVGGQRDGHASMIGTDVHGLGALPPVRWGTVIVPLALLVGALCLALGAWAAWFVVRDRAVVLRQLWGAAVIEGVLVLQAAIAGILAATGSPDVDGVLLWGYVLTQALILPIAAAWAFAERTRWSSVVLLVAALTVAFLEFRLLQIWGTV